MGLIQESVLGTNPVVNPAMKQDNKTPSTYHPEPSTHQPAPSTYQPELSMHQPVGEQVVKEEKLVPEKILPQPTPATPKIDENKEYISFTIKIDKPKEENIGLSGQSIYGRTKVR